jgi:hypothetical protein
MNTRVPLLCALALLCAPVVQAAPIVYTASLTGTAESPPNASPGTGSATVIYDDVAHSLDVTVDFQDLLGTTTASHIHCCTAAPFAGTAGVATQVPTFVGFPLGVQSGTYHHVFDLTDPSSWNPAFITASGGTAAAAEMAFAVAAAQGETYLNIHTDLFRAGEIRGFLVPEPASLSLFAFGALAALRRRRARLS